MLSLLTLLLCGSLYNVHCKPVSEVLPHSRDYYAGYIKAITDNFDQLFSSERQPRSTSEEDEDDVLTKPDTGIKAANNDDNDSLKEVKRDVTGDISKTATNTTKKAEVSSEEQKEDSDAESDDDTDTEDANKKTTTVATPSKAETKPEDSRTEKSSDKKSKLDESEEEDETQTENDEENDDKDTLRKSYVLEHTNEENPSIFPNILSGYQDGPQPDEINLNELYGQFPMQSAIGVPNAAFGQLISNVPVGESPMAGIGRSAIKSKKSNCIGDGHHLHRILVLPDCHHEDCCNDDCGGIYHHGCCCNNHHCSGHISHHRVHDIHHWPVGCPEHYSHESPCLTYPHVDHVGYGYPNDDSCDCCCHPYQSHHPVILHPTYQECHHHNIHVVGTDCHNHRLGCCSNHHNCGCGYVNVCNHHPCNIHHHINHVHHVYEDCHHGNVHHGCHHGHGVVILPHYGHTISGHHGWNPYWGH